MTTKETYMEKIDAELDSVRDQLTKFKAQSTVSDNEARSNHSQYIRDLEQKFDQVKAKLCELEKADEDTWEQIKDSVEDIWTTLQSTLEDTVARFKEES